MDADTISQMVRTLICERPADEQVAIFERVATMAMTELFNDSVAPRYGISKAEAQSALKSVELKAKSILGCI